MSTEAEPGVPHRIPLSGESGSECRPFCGVLSVKRKEKLIKNY